MKGILILLAAISFVFFCGFMGGRESMEPKQGEERVKHIVYKHDLFIIGGSKWTDYVISNLTKLEATDNSKTVTWYFHTNQTNLSLEQ